MQKRRNVLFLLMHLWIPLPKYSIKQQSKQAFLPLFQQYGCTCLGQNNTSLQCSVQDLRVSQSNHFGNR